MSDEFESRTPSKGLPWWAWGLLAVPVAIGGGYVLYKVGTTIASSFAAGPQAADHELTKWSDEYAKELSAITAQNRLPNASEEYALKAKIQRIDDAYNKLFTIYGVAEDVLIGVIATAALAYIVTRVARDYWNSHVGQVKTPAAAIELYRCCEAVDAYGLGSISYAVALNTQNETIFTSLYSPLYQADVYALQGQLSALTGLQLEYTELLITDLQVELETIIPDMLLATTALLVGL
jgi:hypothetical protein